jgi:hypothetical protein
MLLVHMIPWLDSLVLLAKLYSLFRLDFKIHAFKCINIQERKYLSHHLKNEDILIERKFLGNSLFSETMGAIHVQPHRTNFLMSR